MTKKEKKKNNIINPNFNVCVVKIAALVQWPQWVTLFPVTAC